MGNIISGVVDEVNNKINFLYQCCSNALKQNSTNNTKNKDQKNFTNPLSIIEDKYSDKNLTNTEAQTIQKTLNDEELNIEEDNIDEEVSKEIISQLQNVVEKAPRLELIIKESLFFKEKTKIKINALGLEEKSLRKEKDGFTYFGLNPPSDERNIKKIDFSTGDGKIDLNNNENNTIHYGRQFRIRFDLEENSYFIKDCSGGIGYGTFMKVINEMKIKDSTLINIGNYYIVFTLGVDELEPEETDNLFEKEKEKILSVKVFGGELINYSYAFNQSQINKILIGSNEDCNIFINDNLLDGVHCNIQFKKYKGWIINDGYNNKASESGTWFCLSDETKIDEGMIIQSNQNIYECHIIE